MKLRESKRNGNCYCFPINVMSLHLFIHYQDIGWMSSQGERALLHIALVAWKRISSLEHWATSRRNSFSEVGLSMKPPSSMGSWLHLGVTHNCVSCLGRCCQSPSHIPSAPMALAHTICEIPTANTGRSFSNHLPYSLASQGVKALGAVLSHGVTGPVSNSRTPHSQEGPDLKCALCCLPEVLVGLSLI